MREIDAFEQAYKNGYERAEKDTTKKIVELIKHNGILAYGGYVIYDSTIEQIYKQCGMEVE